MKISINKANALAAAIQALSKQDDKGKPVFALPFKFTYALARTLTRLQEALKPIQEENQRIFDGWDPENRKHQAKIKKADDATRDKLIDSHTKAFNARNEQWKKVVNGDIDVEIYQFPEFTQDELDAIFASGLTPQILSDLDPMGLSIEAKAA